MHKILLLSACIFLSFSGGPEEGSKPGELTVNFLLFPDRVFLNGYPLSIELLEAVLRNENFQFTEIKHRQPLLGWQLHSDHPNTLQSAYRILVASSMEHLNMDEGDMWDTGKTSSEQSINIRYRGEPLGADQVYFWKVKTWDNHGVESAYSSTQQFKTASELIDYYGHVYPGTSHYPLQKTDVAPVSLKPIHQGHTLIDFGKANFGRLRVSLFGSPEIDSVLVHLGEKLEGGTIDRDPEGSIRYERFSLGLRPGWNTYEILIPPHYYNNKPGRIIRMPKYMGKVLPFRYCEIENYPADLLKPEGIQQITVHYPFNEEASDFFSSDTVLNAVWELCKHTVKATSFCGIYVDGDRERFPREADSYVNQLSHYGVDREFSLARTTHEFQIQYSSQWTEWLMQVVFSAWADYMETGDPSSMEYFYEDLKAKTLIALAREDGLISTKTGLVTMDVIKSVHWHELEWRRQKTDSPAFRDIVDWPHPRSSGPNACVGETDGFEFTHINTVVNAFHYRTLVIMGQIAQVLDKTADADFFQRRAELVNQSFNDLLLDPKTGIYRDGEGSEHSSLHANMFPLAFGLVPEENLEEVAGFVKSRGLVCSPYGALYLLESLYEAGDSEYALELLTSTGVRSWGRWIYEFGSTVSLESWGPEFKPNLDWSHAWGSAPGSIIPRKLMGIEALEPGYRKIRIRPQPGSLDQASIKYPTIRGEVGVAYTRISDSAFELSVCLPANMEAEIHLPSLGSEMQLSVNKKAAKYRILNNILIIENLGSGEHLIKASMDPN